MKVRAVQVLFNELLPPEFRDYTKPIDNKFIQEALRNVAEKYPEKYEDISKKIMSLGREVSFQTGETIRMKDLESPVDKHAIFAQMDRELADVENRPDFTPADITAQKQQIHAKYADLLEKETLEKGRALGNSLVNHVVSGSRGKPFQVKAIVTTPAVYTDYKDRQIPVFIRNSFSEGLQPHEFYASTFGVRKGVVATKMSTAEAGDFGKQLSTAGEDMLITEDDCGTTNGIPSTPDDSDNIGGVLAHTADGFPGGTTITKKVLDGLKNENVEHIMVRSPLTCQAKDGGVCSHCVGIREKGIFPHVGENVGVTAAQAIAEPIAQGGLSTKHTAGGLSGGAKKVYSGFPVLEQLVQSPEVFPNRAVVSEADGFVSEIKPAPQGGNYVMVGDKEHYVHPDYELTAKIGDRVEAGDQLSDGIIDPADIVRLKGLGEGRIYFVDRMRQALKDNGTPTHRRNLELVGRSLLNHVKITNADGLGEFLPDDIASYNKLARNYRPRPNAVTDHPDRLLGKYLEYPILHHTVGTRITPSIAKNISENGIEQITAHDEPPEFEAEMVRLRANTHNSLDWMTKLHSSYLQKNLLTDTSRARESPFHSTSPIPALAKGVEFGQPGPGQVGY